MQVLALTKYGRAAASPRQRLLQFLPRLSQAGFEVRWQPLLGDDYVRHLATGRGYSKAAVLRAYLRRLRLLATSGRYDLIWVSSELFPFLPSPFERLALRSGTPVVFDCDDALFHLYERRGPLLRRKLDPLIAGARLCCCGSAYLAAYAQRLCEDVRIIPTVVDTAAYRPRDPTSAEPEPPLIGWIGSPTTWPNVRPLLPLLEELVRSGQARVRAIGAGATAAADLFPGLELAEWTEADEVEEVRRMDIGIMPLLDLPFHRGKCGYKLIQYMACGLPAVASPVGVNVDIVEHGRTGFLARDTDEWRWALLQLLENPRLRSTMGAEGRRRVEADYSLAAVAPAMIEAWRDAAAGALRRPAAA